MLDWLETRIPDYEPETQERVFREMLLKMDCAQVSERGLRCFKAHFEHINQRAGNLKKVTPSKLVRRKERGIDVHARLVFF